MRASSTRLDRRLTVLAVLATAFLVFGTHAAASAAARASALPPRCPRNVESVLSSAQHTQCLADIQMDRVVFYSSEDSQATRALICRSPSCTLVLEALYLYELLTTPFDSCVLGAHDAHSPPVIIDSGAIFDLVNNCDRHGLERSLRRGDAKSRARALADAANGGRSPRKGVVFGIAVVALFFFLAFTFFPRRQEGALKGKSWFAFCVGLAAPVWS